MHGQPYRVCFLKCKNLSRHTTTTIIPRTILIKRFVLQVGTAKLEYTVEEVTELMIMEQLVENMPPELELCVSERKLKTVEETGRLLMIMFGLERGQCRR